ncbi:site-2 protease family protein [Saccharibacillus endophyticus]|uniref:Peptidase M50 domain-containing protein n=1 Tax=Saccharibacillus endophyticus TaxID=2060666 RepID=A0ABQ2A169_9BACL|nr:site-2 protease family protein [Saccharibacillus endophyticus]GGH82108.1 hypothetical protein GCM10007362_32920 [Saccharibacillus endophyticus]
MFRKVFPLLIGAAVGALVATVAVRLGREGIAGNAALESATGPAFGGWHPAVVILGAAAMAMIAILIHEFGHILGAVMVRSRVTRLYWGPLICLFPERRIRFAFRNRYFFGAMQTDMQAYHDEASFARGIRAQRIVNAAGPASSLITGLVAYGFSASPWSVAGIYALLSVGIGLATLFSDGVNAILLGRRNHALVSGWTMLLQDQRMDEQKLKFLNAASKLYLQELAATSAPAKGRETHDLFLVYYVKLMDGETARQPAAKRLIEETKAAWSAAIPAKLSKPRRDTLVMVLAEEVVRLCGDGLREEAEQLYAEIGGRSAKPSPLLLKARAFIEGTENSAREYVQSVRAMHSDLASYGALIAQEERRMAQA